MVGTAKFYRHGGEVNALVRVHWSLFYCLNLELPVN